MSWDCRNLRGQRLERPWWSCGNTGPTVNSGHSSPGFNLEREREEGGNVGHFTLVTQPHAHLLQPQNLFKFVPEISKYVSVFLEGCQDDPKRQFAMMVAFTSITNQGLPVMPTFWHVTRFLSSEALQSYVAWLRDMFLQPDLDSLVDFSTTNQKRAQDASVNV